MQGGSHSQVIRLGESVTLTQSVSLTVYLTVMNWTHTVIIVIFVHKSTSLKTLLYSMSLWTSSDAFLRLAHIHEERQGKYLRF